jgi:protein-S-isoprenylcysteine O-methyltransferase Ste14
MKSNSKMILGYIVGGLLVLVFMPLVIYGLTKLINIVFSIMLFPDIIIRYCIAFILISIGMVFGLWSIILQNKLGKGGPLEIGKIEISPKTKNLVTSGPYKYTRNPMLFGTTMAYLGYAVLLNHLISIILVCLIFVFMIMIVVNKEEKRLHTDFGDRYDIYKAKTSLFIPRIKYKNKLIDNINK